MGFLQTASVIS